MVPADAAWPPSPAAMTFRAPQVDTVLPLAEASKAHAIGEQGRTNGKIVLTVA
jgi:NADPH:quinone reductase-like Zn-dependent oxidoreductase